MPALFVVSDILFKPHSWNGRKHYYGTLSILGLHIPIMRTLDFYFPCIMYEFLPVLFIPICYLPILLLEQKCPVLLVKYNIQGLFKAYYLLQEPIKW